VNVDGLDLDLLAVLVLLEQAGFVIEEVQVYLTSTRRRSRYR